MPHLTYTSLLPDAASVTPTPHSRSSLLVSVMSLTGHHFICLRRKAPQISTVFIFVSLAANTGSGSVKVLSQYLLPDLMKSFIH